MKPPSASRHDPGALVCQGHYGPLRIDTGALREDTAVTNAKVAEAAQPELGIDYADLRDPHSWRCLPGDDRSDLEEGPAKVLSDTVEVPTSGRGPCWFVVREGAERGTETWRCHAAPPNRDRGDHRAGLAEKCDVTRRRREMREARVEPDAGHDQPDAVRAINAADSGARHRAWRAAMPFPGRRVRRTRP